MLFIRDMKISMKLSLSFGFLIVVAILIAVVSINSKGNLQSEAEYVLAGPFERYSLGRALERNIIRATGIRDSLGMYAGIEDEFERLRAINGQVLQFDLIMARINEIVSDYRSSMDALDISSEEIIAYRHSIMDGVVSSLFSIDFLFRQSVPFAIDNDMDSFVSHSSQSDIAMNDTLSALEELLSYSITFMSNSTEHMEGIASRGTAQLIVIVSISIVVAIAIAVFMTRSIVRPINEMSSIIETVSSGNLEIEFKSDLPKNEIGIMTKDVYELVDIVKNIVDDLTQTYNEYMDVGNMQFQIDDSKYENSFNEAVGLVNKLLSRMTEDMDYLRDQLILVSDGDFSVRMDTKAWPGEWRTMPETVNQLARNLKNVGAEINAMIDAAATKGDLSFRVSSENYKGDWSRIMDGLNDIAISVDKPLKVIALAMSEMKAGNLKFEAVASRIDAAGYETDLNNYKGDFKDIVTNVSETIATISNYIEIITGDLEKIASGDLTSKITTDFVGDFAPIKGSLNNISVTLNKTMSEISLASDHVLSGASQIATSAQELANGAGEQASFVEELNATIDIINQQIQQNANDAMEASELSKRSTTNAVEGNESMKQMLVAMTQIKDSSSEISKIIKAIQGIAFQTNLLALNAAVEAARAGEHGKGFSVVAEEVRSLAVRSQGSATETTVLIETSNNRVESGSSIAEATSKSLDVIVENASEVSALINNIAAASKEQSNAIVQVSQGLEQISKVTQSNSAVSEETAAATEELNSQAEMLKKLVTYFKL